MTLFQAVNASEQILNHNFFFYIEILIIMAIIVFQFGYSTTLYKKIKTLRTIFKNSLTVITGSINKTKIGNSKNILSEIQYNDQENSSEKRNDSMVKLTLVKSSGDNEIIDRIKNALNSYIISNYGAAVNFSIIKDIIDREVEAKDEEISQSIPTPLYLGLAATMVGIICGLFAMPELNGDGFAEGINALINGVKIAMFASLTGLICTTYLSSFFYKKAKNIVLKDKNDQLSYLQAKLLPELVRADETGTLGLKASLDRFAREATKISDNVFAAANQTGNNLQKQLTIISKVENLNMTKVSNVNLDLFNRLESNMTSFERFSTYLAQMDQISDNLVKFSTRSDDFGVIANKISSTLNESQGILKFLQLHSESLTAHIEQIQNAGGSAVKAVDIADSYFRESIDKLKEETDKRINELYNLSNTSDVTLKETFEEIGIKLNEVTSTHLDSLATAYNESIPHFNQLDNLNLLPEIKDKTTNQSTELINALNLLKSSLDSINKEIDNQPILDRLNKIETSITNKKANSIQRTDYIQPTGSSEKGTKKGIFFSLFNKSNRKQQG